MRAIILMALVGSCWAGPVKNRRQAPGFGQFFNQFNQSFPGPQEAINQFQGISQGNLPTPPPGFPQPPQGFLPQPPQGFLPQPPQGFFPQQGQGFFPTFPSGGSGSTPAQPTQSDFVGRKEPPKVIPIISYDFTPNADGSYKFSYESGDGTKREESGSQKVVGEPPEAGTVSQGSYSYSDPDGNLVQVSYTADERGFIASGSHIPTAPPIPHEILRSLEASAAYDAAQNNGVVPDVYHHYFRTAYRHY